MEMCIAHPTERELRVCDQVEALLDKLDTAGRTASELAAFLRDEGIQGVPGHRARCAIAEYLNSHLDGDYHTTVSSKVTVRHKYDGAPIACEAHTTTRMAFVVQFDLGLYPELVKDVNA